MRHGKTTRNLGVKTAHRGALLRNLLRGLLRDGSIRTTVARAKVLRPFVEKIVTRLKDPTVNNMRHAYSIVNDRNTVHELAHEVAPKFANRNGGYIRILKLARSRPGDNADMALVQWVDEGLVEAGMERRQPAAVKEDKKASKKTPAKKASKRTDAAEGEATEKKAKKTAKKSKK